VGLALCGLAACARDRGPDGASDDVLQGDVGQKPDAGADADHDSTDDAGEPTLCEAYCDLLLGCLEPFCDGLDTLLPRQGCVEQCEPNASFQDVIPTLLDYTCPDMQALACSQLDVVMRSCRCDAVVVNETNVGAACESDAVCDGGDLSARCQPEIDGNGGRTGFTDGYCIVEGCRNTADCGVSGICIQIGASLNCMARCMASNACRDGYACWPSNDDRVGFCFPACGGGVVCSGAGTVCIEGVCRPSPSCAPDNACPGNLQCMNSTCQPKACASNTDCQGALVCANGICN